MGAILMAVASPRRVVSLVGAKRLIYSISAILTIATIAMQVSMFDGDKFLDFSWPQVVALFLLFLIADQVAVEVVIGRQTIAFSISEIPVLLGAFWISPLLMVLIRFPSILYAKVLKLRKPPVRTVLNVCLNYFEMTLVIFLLNKLQDFDTTDVKTWLAVYAVFIPVDLLGASIIMVAITLVQGVMSREQIRAIFLSISDLVNPTVALVALILLDVNAWSGVLLAILGVVLITGYRMYTASLRRFHTIEELYQFTSTIEAAREGGNIADAMLVRARELLGAEQASLWIPAQGRYPEVSLLAKEGEVGVVDDPRGSDDLIRRRVVETGRTVAGSTVKTRLPMIDAELREELIRLGFKDVIAIPLRSGSAVIGCLEVAGRLGELTTFTPDERRLAETLAAHASVAVENLRLVDRLRFDAYHDALTGLANRRQFQTALETAIDVRPSPGEVVAVMQFDVDSLRDVNETLGHEAGDRLLLEVGRRLRERAPNGALVARLGGDEFAVLLRVQGPEAAQATALSLQYALVEPLRLDKFTLDVGAAVGIALFPDHGTDAATLLQRADVASYAAKKNPRSIQLYRPAMEQRSLHRLSLVSELRRAIDDNALTLYYQPKLKVSTKEIVGMESLVRWEHPEHGVVSPDDFIPVAEHTGLVGALTRHVLRDALEQCRRWREAGHRWGVSVNLSPRNLLDPNLPEQLAAMLEVSGVPADQLTLEITESALTGEGDTRAERPIAALRRLHDLGVRLSIDDFGTGFSALAFLRTLPVQEVKIDKSFVFGMATEPGDLGIVRAVVDLGRHLGLTVVAEGVESEISLSLLEEVGCDTAQGFLFSRPLPADKIDEWMALRVGRADRPGAVDDALRQLGIAVSDTGA